MKKLTIITACYNEKNLEKTCESIIRQTWQDFEWVVVDGGSNKETLNIFQKYKSRINVFICEKDDGVYSAYNKGINLSSGEYLNFMNAGDYYNHDNVLKLFYKGNYNSDVLYGNINTLYKNNKNRILKYQNKLDNNFFILDNINTQAVFVKKELFLKYGYFDIHYKIASDYDRWLKFYSENRTFEHLKFTVANYDMSGISSIDKNQEFHKKEREEIQKKYFSDIEILKAKSTCRLKYSFFERIFSIKNSTDKKYKVITIFGIKIKIKRSIK